MSDAMDPRHATGERKGAGGSVLVQEHAHLFILIGPHNENMCACGALEPDPPNDPVRPKHYRGDLVMRILETFGLDEDFNLGNVIKYILRHGEKAGVEDLRKAAWYLERAIAKRDGKLSEKLT